MTDTLHHRGQTDAVTPDAVSTLEVLPPALALRGWALLPVTWHDWITLLGQLPSAPPAPACGLRPGQWNDVFTDGSCIAQSSPYYRLAAWSAVCVPLPLALIGLCTEPPFLELPTCLAYVKLLTVLSCMPLRSLCIVLRVRVPLSDCGLTVWVWLPG